MPAFRVGGGVAGVARRRSGEDFAPCFMADVVRVRLLCWLDGVLLLVERSRLSHAVLLLVEWVIRNCGRPDSVLLLVEWVIRQRRRPYCVLLLVEGMIRNCGRPYSILLLVEGMIRNRGRPDSVLLLVERVIRQPCRSDAVQLLVEGVVRQRHRMHSACACAERPQQAPGVAPVVALPVAVHHVLAFCTDAVAGHPDAVGLARDGEAADSHGASVERGVGRAGLVAGVAAVVPHGLVLGDAVFEAEVVAVRVRAGRLDVYLAPSGGVGSGGAEEVVVERWTVACEPWPSPAAAAAVGEGLAVNRAYKRCITLLRSLYAALRFLPAYRAFRTLCASGQVYNYEMGHRVGSFAAPFSRAEEAAMRTNRFAPVETQLGRLVLSVQYRPSLAAFNFEVTSLAPAAIIMDYVGSPAAEPMRAFPASLTEAAVSPSSQPSRRPSSWASPAPWPHTPGQQAKFSPPPTHYASPTPSPPTFGYLHSRFSSETVPMSIPQVGGGRGPVHHRNMSEPTRAFMFPPPSPKSVRGEAGMQESPTEANRSFKRADGIRMGDLYANLPSGSKIKDSRDESGRFSGVFSSSGSPRLGFSRSSSRLSMQDDTDDADFPFAVDDVDPDSRPGSSSGKDTAGDQAGSSSHKSQDAAVGYLVHLLKSARPLRDSSYSTHTSRGESVEAGSTSSFMSRRTSDALEELDSFREIKENLLARSRSRLQDSLDQP